MPGIRPGSMGVRIMSNDFENGRDVAIVTIELLDWPDSHEFPSIIAVPARLTLDDIDSGWSWPNKGGLERIAERVIDSIDWDILSSSVPYELRGVRWNHSDALALLPGETLMTRSQVNEMFTRMRQADEQENIRFGIA